MRPFFPTVIKANFAYFEIYLQKFLGASLSEPHTSVVNGEILYMYVYIITVMVVVRPSVRLVLRVPTSPILGPILQNMRVRWYKCLSIAEPENQDQWNTIAGFILANL